MLKKGLFNLDYALVFPLLILIGISLATLFSIDFELFKSQLVFLGVSLFALIFFANINYRSFGNYSLFIYLFSLISLIVVLLIGRESHGASRWINIFGYSLQFSEIIKPLLIISLAWFLSQKETSLKVYLTSICFLLPTLFLLYKQPDLGNAIIFAVVFFLTIVSSGLKFKWIFLTFIVFLTASPIFWNFMHDYQRQRLLTFINPSSDPFGASYNVIQSVIAVGSGMFSGKGMTQGTQSAFKFLPEKHTDFIFATISENLGFIGSMIILFAFSLLLYRIYLIFINSKDRFSKIFSAGAFFLILIQSFFNIGMNIGVIPVVGITLPFVSYGGSSLLSNFILIGLLSSLSYDMKSKNVLEIR